MHLHAHHGDRAHRRRTRHPAKPAPLSHKILSSPKQASTPGTYSPKPLLAGLRVVAGEGPALPGDSATSGFSNATQAGADGTCSRTEGLSLGYFVLTWGWIANQS